MTKRPQNHVADSTDETRARQAAIAVEAAQLESEREDRKAQPTMGDWAAWSARHPEESGMLDGVPDWQREFALTKAAQLLALDEAREADAETDPEMDPMALASRVGRSGSIGFN